MPIGADLLSVVTTAPPQQAWQAVSGYVWQHFSAPISAAAADAEVVRRDKDLNELDNVVSGSSWELWADFEASVPKATNWLDCVNLVGSQTGFVFWHHWPDARMHDLAGPGASLHKLAKETHQKLTSDDFWALVERLTTGRRLVITSDHGYAACGHFHDIVEKDQAA